MYKTVLYCSVKRRSFNRSCVFAPPDTSSLFKVRGVQTREDSQPLPEPWRVSFIAWMHSTRRKTCDFLLRWTWYVLRFFVSRLETDRKVKVMFYFSGWQARLQHGWKMAAKRRSNKDAGLFESNAVFHSVACFFVFFFWKFQTHGLGSVPQSWPGGQPWAWWMSAVQIVPSHRTRHGVHLLHGTMLSADSWIINFFKG